MRWAGVGRGSSRTGKITHDRLRIAVVVNSSRRRKVVAIIGHSRWATRTRCTQNRIKVLAAIQRAHLVVLEIYEFHQNPITDGLTRQRLRRQLRQLSDLPDSVASPVAVVPFGAFTTPLPIMGCEVLYLPDPLLND